MQMHAALLKSKVFDNVDISMLDRVEWNKILGMIP